MTNTKHPITPPPELVEQWVQVHTTKYDLARKAAQWGADEQLEQDARWLDTHALFSEHLTITPSGDALRQAMCPKTPSLKEQALDELHISFDRGYLKEGAADTIRRALEQLDD
jgi:hypothetical protein